MAKKLREEIDAGRLEEDRGNILRFVNNSFSLQMEDKAWWIS